MFVASGSKKVFLRQPSLRAIFLRGASNPVLGPFS